jgi:hypothetical protein
MKRLAIAVLLAVAGCGANMDESVSTNNPDPDASISVPTDVEMQEQRERTEAFAATVIGMTEAEAITAIEDAGFIARVVARDGEYFAVTEDYSVSRINLVVVDDRVTEATVG